MADEKAPSDPPRSRNSGPSEQSLHAVLRENCEHTRHIEVVRTAFTQVYAAIVTGVLAALAITGIERGVMLIFLVAFSLAGLVATYNWNSAHANHVSRARLTAGKLGVDEYLALGRLFESEGKWRRWLLRPWELYVLYLLVIVVSVYLLISPS